jgi:hypothetical protein
MLAQHFAGRGAGHVHGHVAAADHQDLFSDGEAVAEIDVEQKVDALVNAVQVYAGDGEIAAAVRAHGDQHRVEVTAQIGNGEIAAGCMVQFQRDVAGRENLAHLRFHHVARQAILRQAEIEHSARHLRCFKDGDRIAHQRQVVRGRQADGARAYDSNSEGKAGLRAACVHIDRPCATPGP